MEALNNIDHSRSYATEDLLKKHIKKYGFDKERHIIVLNREHRFTAIFANPQGQGRDANVAAIHIAQKGFMVFG